MISRAGCTLLLVAPLLAQGPPPHLGQDDLDWLVHDGPWKARVEALEGGRLVLTNGLLRRVIATDPDGATLAIDELTRGTSLLRAVKPEAEVVIDGALLPVGGLSGQPDHAFLLPEWEAALTRDEGALHLVDWEVGTPLAFFGWKRVRHAQDRPWPPAGVRLAMRYRSAALAAVTVTVHHELLDGLPALSKWLEVSNDGDRPLTLDRFTCERLALVEAESRVDTSGGARLPDVLALTDMAFGGMSLAGSNAAVRWLPDPEYRTQVNYARQTPCLLECAPPLGPALTIAPGETFRSFKSHLLVFDSTDRERQGLATRALLRTLAPWVTENPIQMHVRSADPAAVRLAIDQCAAVGFELVILTFGSGFDMENADPAYLAAMRELARYAHARGVELGGYSLLSSRRIGPETDVIDLETGQPGGARFGNAPCLQSAWGLAYFELLEGFLEATGFDLLEHDGSYPGDACASNAHVGHDGHADSIWKQWARIRDFYGWCRERGVYLNVPDHYFLAGSNKVGMGYRESNWSLPREWQVLHARQNVFDGTWTKTPSMGWMFVPLVQYHGGGAAAVLEPLSEHLDAYEAHLANLFGAGVQAAYRGPRLYDSEQTRAVVATWVDWFKAHREVLEADVLHLRRADGRDLDALLHVNPRGAEKGLLVVWNPLGRELRRPLRVPLYYTGLTDEAQVSGRDGQRRRLELDRRYGVELEISVPARGVAWYVFE